MNNRRQIDRLRRRGVTQDARGYGADYQRLRRRWAPIVAAGSVSCRRCGRLIDTGERWDLGHDDHDRSDLSLAGPEHVSCNRRAGARSKRKRVAVRSARTWSREWL